MEKPFIPPRRTWVAKFAAAFRGWRLGSRGQSSFHVHFPVTAVVLGTAVCLRVTATEWCLLVMCIVGVLSAEFMNSALESLAKAVTHDHNEHIACALDIGSGAVLLTGLGSAVVGLCIFVPRLFSLA